MDDIRIIWERDGKEIGRIVLHIQHEEIADLVIEPEFRRQGIAFRLVKIAEEAARQAGLNRVSATVRESNMPSKMLWSKLDYERLLKYEKKLGNSNGL